MCGPPQHWPGDWSDELKATALATEPWRHSNWINYLGVDAGYGGFDQFGTLFGQVHRQQTTGNDDDDDDTTSTTVLNLPGVRQRRWTPDQAERVRRSVSIVGVCPDGSVFVLGAHSLENNLTK